MVESCPDKYWATDEIMLRINARARELRSRVHYDCAHVLAVQYHRVDDHGRHLTRGCVDVHARVHGHGCGYVHGHGCAECHRYGCADAHVDVRVHGRAHGYAYVNLPQRISFLNKSIFSASHLLNNGITPTNFIDFGFMPNRRNRKNEIPRDHR